MVYFKENHFFSRFQRGPIFSKGGVGEAVQLSPGGGEVQWLIPYRNPYNL